MLSAVALAAAGKAVAPKVTAESNVIGESYEEFPPAEEESVDSSTFQAQVCVFCVCVCVLTAVSFELILGPAVLQPVCCVSIAEARELVCVLLRRLRERG